jgi:hypothetical protein
MKEQKQDITYFIQNALFMAFFMVILLAFSSHRCRCESGFDKPDLISVSSSKSTDAVVSVDAKLPSPQQFWTWPLVKLHFKPNTEDLKLLTDNKKVHQIIVSFQKYEQLIKPINIHRFYHYLFPAKAEELPILS